MCFLSVEVDAQASHPFCSDYCFGQPADQLAENSAHTRTHTPDGRSRHREGAGPETGILRDEAALIMAARRTEEST